MKYCRDFSSNDVTNYGLSIFLIMSTKHFEPLATYLGCTFTFDDRLRQIAREFIEKAFPIIGISTPFKKAESDVDDIELYLQSWHTAFDKLDSIGYANEICNWIKKLRTEETNNIHARIRTDTPLWLLEDWSMERWIPPSLELPNAKTQQIKIYVLQLFVDNLEWQTRLKRLTEDIDFDEWEEFAYKRHRGETWMSLQMGSHRLLTMWIQIFETLTKQEVIIFGQWWDKSMQSYAKHFNPDTHADLAEFASDLRKLGYISN